MNTGEEEAKGLGRKAKKRTKTAVEPFKPQYSISNSSFLSPYISHRSSGEKLLQYQEKLTIVIMFSILMTSLTDKPLILQ